VTYVTSDVLARGHPPRGRHLPIRSSPMSGRTSSASAPMTSRRAGCPDSPADHRPRVERFVGRTSVHHSVWRAWRHRARAPGPHIVLWTMARLADLTNLPQPRLVIRFDLTDIPAEPLLAAYGAGPRGALPHAPGPPGGRDRDDYLRVASQMAHGWVSLPAAQRRRVIKVVGPARLARTLNSLGRSPFAGVTPAVRQHRCWPPDRGRSATPA
jgi:hypothetical protein